jgi:tetratricopeptide (TPR) repeat protein
MIEFVKDGILIINNQGARYRIIDKERVEFDLGEMGLLLAIFSGGGPRPILRFAVSDDELVLTPLASPDETERFRRVKVNASGKDTDEYYNRGNTNFKQNNYQQAIKDLQRAIQINSKLVLAYLNIARSYSIQNNAAMACDWLKKAIEKGYNYWEILQKDKDFDNIRNTSCYQEIIKSH